MGVSVADLVGNSLKLKEDVRAYRGSPNSDNFVIWKANRFTDPIYSWVEVDGDVWLMFGRQQPSYYVKADPAKMEPVAERGASQYLSEKYGGTKEAQAASLFNVPDLSGLSGVLENGIKIVLGLAALIFGIKILDLFK